jgi:hypothetical protein
MTLRDLGNSFLQYWQDYYATVTTTNPLDWRISYIVWSLIFAVVIVAIWEAVKAAWDADNLKRKRSAELKSNNKSSNDKRE